MPRAARSFVLVVVATGAATASSWLPGMATWGSHDWPAFAAIALATSVAERFPLELLYRNERAMYSLADAIWTAALLLVRPSVLTLSVVAGVLLGQLLARRPPLKVAFNVAQYVLGITAAVGVFEWLGAPSAHEPAGWLAAGVAMAAFQLVNTVLVGAILALVERRPFRQVALASTGVLHWSGNVAAGILGALVWTAQPSGLPVLLVPLALTYLAYRGWLRTLQERDWMDEMGRAAELIARSGDLSRRLTETGRANAVGRLGATLNDMLARLEASFRRERTFIRQSSHELRTPITICRGYLDVLSPMPDPEELAETIDVVKDELARMSRLVDDLSGLAYMEDPASLRHGEVPLDQFVGEVAGKARPLLNGRLQVEPLSERTLLRGDIQRLTQALINLIQNARDHTPRGSPIRLRVVGEARTLRFEIADEGGGLPPDAELQVFQPFYKGNRSKGSGLGLAIVLGIARAHGGAAGLENRRGDGATFWVRVPR
jgi:signal transduction histidine kinase